MFCIFLDDYRLTACLGILKWVVDKHNSPVKEQDEQMELDTENKVENSIEHKENSAEEKESSTDENDKSESKNEKACKPPVTTVSPRSQRKSKTSCSTVSFTNCAPPSFKVC